MKRTARLAAILACGAVTLAGRAHAQQRTLQPFSSDAELLAYHRRVAQANARWLEKHPIPPPPPPAPPEPGAEPADRAAESVTNVQHAGVDEGGIVKVHGDYLVILRRGRLFTVRIGGGELRPVSATDAFGPKIDPNGAWYDEMLISGDRVAVIGYSYARGGTEVGVFQIDDAGRLTHRSTWHLRSGDYYSSRNYASRLIGSKLIFYAPLPVYDEENGGLQASFPAFRRWDAADSTFRRTAPVSRVYRPALPLRPQDWPVLHSVTVCDLAADDLGCRATALYGPGGNVFYVSPTAVYVWAVSYAAGDEGPTRSILYRMPLDGGAPTALRTEGAPVDPLSFLERGGVLNVLVLSAGRGDAMWTSNWAWGSPALLRVPLAALGDGTRSAPREMYRGLPKLPGSGFQNRFVGDWLFYGMEWPQSGAPAAPLVAVRYAARDSIYRLPVGHGVSRIETMGAGALAVGRVGSDLRFTGVRLGASAAELAGVYTRRNAAQAESRSHGFFYRADGPDAGLAGLPIRGEAAGEAYPRRGSASVLFVRNDAFRLTEAGELAAKPAEADDHCRASCVDWYGNARPLFLRGRIFALMGYELVEGEMRDGRMREVRRVTFLP